MQGSRLETTGPRLGLESKENRYSVGEVGCRVIRALGGGEEKGVSEDQELRGPCSPLLSLTFSFSVQIWIALGISLAVFSFFRHVTSFNWMEI